MTALRLSDYSGPAILSFGFRPFFLVGTAYSVFAILYWLLAFLGWISIPTLFLPVDWHIHEMLFGYVPAVLAGFLLTAIPNWTGRLPVRGRSLALLLTLWIVGRLAISLSSFAGWQMTLIIDNLFLTALVAAVANEIIAGKNWRNLKMLVPITLLLFANVGFHLEAHVFGSTDISRRLGFGVVVFLISLIGGRIIPSFTRNWLARHNPGRMPVNFNRLDAAVIICSTISLAIWAFVPDRWITGTCLIIAGALHFIRLSRWEGVRAWREPMVLILHIAYLFLPIGFVLTGFSAMPGSGISSVAGFHAFGAGAIGLMTMAVMLRATLGHTGRSPEKAPLSVCVFMILLVSATLRIIAALFPTVPIFVVETSGIFWLSAYLSFLFLHAIPLLTYRRL